MPLSLTVLSVLALWTFLAMVALALLRFGQALESVRSSLEEFLAVIRLIATQTQPLGALGVAFAQELSSTVEEMAPLARATASIDRGLAVLRRRDGGV